MSMDNKLEENGIILDGKILNNRRFADHIVIFATSAEQL